MTGARPHRHRPIAGPSDWKRYEVVLDVPEESYNIMFGMILHGAGQVWADDFELEIVGSDVASTGRVGFEKKAKKPS